jgi:hypothetical protein
MANHQDPDERPRLKDLQYIFPRKYSTRRTPISDAIDDVVRFIIEKDPSLADKFLDKDAIKYIVDQARIRIGEKPSV